MRTITKALLEVVKELKLIRETLSKQYELDQEWYDLNKEDDEKEISDEDLKNFII